MEIQKTSALTVPSLLPKNLPRLLEQLRPGYSFEAVVEAKLAENSVMLKLAGGQLLRAQIPHVLEPGQLLKLEVVKAGTVPELKIIAPAQNAVPPEQGVVTQALRQFLPKQQNLADFAVSLRQVAASATHESDPAGAAIHKALGVLPSKDDLLSADGLKRGVDNSGIFLEAKLTGSPLAAQGDLKGQLLALAEALQKPGSLPDALAGPLLHKTEGALARIVLDQLASLPENSWRLEIPYTDGRRTDAVKVRIDRENPANPAGVQASWSVVLELNPPGLGTLHSRISLVGEVVDTYFWSDQKTTAELAREHLDLLSARYTQAGLKAGRLNVLDAAPVTVKSDFLPASALLDERA
jgi:hypothetical protein